MTEVVFTATSETGQMLSALRGAASNVPDGWVRSSDVRAQLRVVRAQLQIDPLRTPAPPVAIRLREMFEAGILERRQIEGGVVFYREAVR